MATMAVSYRFELNSTRSERYESFIERLQSKGRIWEETTSFALVETSLTAAQLERDLWTNSDFNYLMDKMIVIDVTGRDAATRGNIEDAEKLRSLLPKVIINTV